jgi:hypothetical protein
MSTYETYKRKFRTNPTINPETNRTIEKNGPTYNMLVKKYGEPIKYRSPSKGRVENIKANRKAASPRRSPVRKNVPTSPEESILRVLYKLDNENQRIWCESSPKVRAVCQKNNLM